jgi:hypothetical protein
MAIWRAIVFPHHPNPTKPILMGELGDENFVEVVTVVSPCLDHLWQLV